jgi:CheY-like chemotaxis protein
MAPNGPDLHGGNPGGPDDLWGLAGRRVLVAEDNLTNQTVVRAMLSATGLVIETVADGDEALERLRAASFDLVLMDMRMPRMDGMEALSRIRAGEAGDPTIPVIALTADASALDDDRLLARGFDAVQPKPIQSRSLILAIIEACRDRPDSQSRSTALG